MTKCPVRILSAARFLSLALATVLLAIQNAGAQTAETVHPPGEQAATQEEPPRLPDGRIDYLERLNRKLAQGATPENNAVVLLLEAQGPMILDGINQEDFLRRLGLDMFPSGTPALTSGWEEFEEDEARLEQVLARPWTASEFPEIARWLENNRDALILVTEATKRQKYYQPMLIGEPDDNPSCRILASQLPLSQECRQLARILATRVMLHAGKGETEAAVEDVKSIRRLANLMSRSVVMIEILIAIAIDGIGQNAELRLLESGQLSPSQIEDYRKFLQESPLAIDLGECLESGEKETFNDMVQSIRLDGAGSLSDISGGGSSKWDQWLRSASVDWDVVREADSIYAEMAEACREPDEQLRLEKLDEIEQELTEYEKEIQKLAGFRSLVMNRQSRSKLVGKMLVCMLAPASRAVATAETRAEMQRDLTDIALALELYRLKHKKFPDQLEKLAPQFLDSIPVDRFTGEELYYLPESAGYLLYSAGLNRKDDGGASFDVGTGDVGIKIKLAMPGG